MHDLLPDLRSALRQLIQRPALHLLIVAILGVAVGANTAMFTLADAALFRSLPVADPERLYRAFVTDAAGNDQISNASLPQVEDLAREIRGIDGVAGYADWGAAHVARAGQAAERVGAGVASGNFFAVLGVTPALGRLFTPEDDRPGLSQPVAVASHHYWRTRLNADPGALGSVITVNRQPFTLIGVAPAGFHGPGVGTNVALWFPMQAAPLVMSGMVRAEQLADRGLSWLDIVLRLAPGTALPAVQAELAAHSQRRDEADAKAEESRGAGNWYRLLPATTAAVDPYGTEGTRRNAWLLTGIVGLLLALACANVAGLLMVRGDERVHEIAVRLGLGAPRRRVVRQLLVECALLAALAIALGLMFARAVLLWIAHEAPSGVTLPIDPGSAVLEPRVLAASAGFAAFALLTAGLVPAWRATRIEVSPALKGSAASSTSGRSRQAWRGALVATQVAASVVLLVVAGLLLRSFAAATRVDVGFDPANGLVFSVDLARHGVAPERYAAEYERLRAAVAALPGVRASGWANSVPVRNGGMRTSIEVDHPDAPKDGASQVNLVVHGEGYLEALGVPLRQGRVATQGDGAAEVVINRRMAELFWPGQEPIGRRIRNLAPESGGAVVVGVLENSRQRSVREAIEPIVYVPFRHFRLGSLSLLLRTSVEPETLLPAVQRAIAALEPELPVLRPQTLADRLAAAYSQERLFALLTGGFAVLAVLLAGAGLYGMLAHALRSRVREIGIRLAIGATRERIVRLVVGRTAALLALGLAVGTIGAAVAARGLAGLLFGVAPDDPLTFAGVLVLVLTVGFLAAWLPTRRAAAIQPSVALRHE